MMPVPDTLYKLNICIWIHAEWKWGISTKGGMSYIDFKYGNSINIIEQLLLDTELGIIH